MQLVDGRNCLQAIYMEFMILSYDKIEKEVKIQYNAVWKGFELRWFCATYSDM